MLVQSFLDYMDLEVHEVLWRTAVAIAATSNCIPLCCLTEQLYKNHVPTPSLETRMHKKISVSIIILLLSIK